MRTFRTPFLVVAASFATSCFLVAAPASFAAEEEAHAEDRPTPNAKNEAEPKAEAATNEEASSLPKSSVSDAAPLDAEGKKSLLGVPLRFHGGLNLRTDLGVHPIRFDAGVQLGPLDLVTVVDPFFPLDGQFSLDVLAAWRFDWGIAPILGWRMNAIGLSGGPQLQQNLVLGIGLDLPQFLDGMLQGQLGLEMAAVVVKHGGDLPTEIISFASARNYLDLLNFGMFARFEFSVNL